MREPRRIGIELDGTTARLVEVRDGRVVAHRSAQAETAALALRDVMGARRPRSAVTVVWTAGVDVRRLPVRTAPRSAWRAALFQAVEDELFVDEDDLAVAGRVAERAGGLLDALVAVGSAAAMGEVWDLVQGIGAALTASTFCERDPDPAVTLELAVRDATAEVTVLQDGRALAVRSVPDGALGPLLAALHVDPAAARARLLRVLTGTAKLDPGAVSVVDEHVARLAADIGEQVRAWRQQGIASGAVIGLAGPGATIPSLPARLREVGLTAVTPGVPGGFDVGEVDPWDRFAYAGALAAAATILDPSDIATFANRRVEAVRLHRHEVAGLRRRRGAAMAGLAGVGLVLAAPLAVSATREGRAEAANTDARRRFAAVASVDAAVARAGQGRAVYAAQASTDIRWAELQRAIDASLPPAAEVESERLSRQGGAVAIDLRIAFAGEPYGSVTAWAGRLRALNQVDPARENAVTIRSFTSETAGTKVHAAVTVVVPLRPPFVEPRSLPGGRA